TKSASAQVTITAPTVVSVTISPSCGRRQTRCTRDLSSDVCSSDLTAVTWQVNGVPGGNATAGTISSAGLYTAPAVVPSPATVTVTAVSQADATKSASAQVTITAPTAVSVTISPTSTSEGDGGAQQLRATVVSTNKLAV